MTGLHLLTGASPWDLESEENFGQWQWREFAEAQGTVLEASFADFIDRLIAKSLSDRFHPYAETFTKLLPGYFYFPTEITLKFCDGLEFFTLLRDYSLYGINNNLNRNK